MDQEVSLILGIRKEWERKILTINFVVERIPFNGIQWYSPSFSPKVEILLFKL